MIVYDYIIRHIYEYNSHIHRQIYLIRLCPTDTTCLLTVTGGDSVVVGHTKKIQQHVSNLIVTEYIITGTTVCPHTIMGTSPGNVQNIYYFNKFKYV